MKRRKTKQIRFGKVKIGAGAPVSIQSMTKTKTKGPGALMRQAKRLEEAGCEILRIALKDRADATLISKLRSSVGMPVEVDIHFDYRLALLAIASGADGIRINPGNIRRDSHVREIARAARPRRVPIRVGVNSGSLCSSPGRQADEMVKAAARCLKVLEKERFYDIMISLKASDVITTIDAYRKMAEVCDYPFHLGVTATGTGTEAIIKSAVGIGTLLAEGIGDTIRVSLTARPEDEIIAAKYILQALGLRRFAPDIISCPTCGRCQVDLVGIVKQFKNLASNSGCGRSCRSIAIMGCEVNGPGEAKSADIGVAFGRGSGALFKNGKIIKKVKAKDAVKELLKKI